MARCCAALAIGGRRRSRLMVGLVGLLAAWSAGVAHGVVVSDNKTCGRVGAPSATVLPTVVRCDFHDAVLELRNTTICEPSQDWLNASGLLRFSLQPIVSTSSSELPYLAPGQVYEPGTGSCLGLPQGQCRYGPFKYCLVDSQAPARECYTPPLQVLQRLVISLVKTYPSLQRVLENETAQCATVMDNVTCVKNPACVWSPSSSSLTRPAIVDEVQRVAVLQQKPPAGSGTGSRSQVQRVRITAAPYDARVVTVSVLLPNAGDANVTASYWTISSVRPNGQANSTRRLGLNADAATVQSYLQEIGIAASVRVATWQAVASVSSSSSSKASSATGGAANRAVAAAAATAPPTTASPIAPQPTAPPPSASPTPRPQQQPMPLSWEIKVDSAATALGLSLNETNVVSAGSGSVLLNAIGFTRHAHNMQTVTLWSTKAVKGGQFILRVRAPSGGSGFLSETKALPWNASEAQVRDELAAMKFSGATVFKFVAVALGEAGQVLPGNATLRASRSWNITMAREVAEYEWGLPLLTVSTEAGDASRGEKCETCSPMVVADGSGASKGATAFTVRGVVVAPRVYGSFEAAECEYSEALPGLAWPDANNPALVRFTLPEALPGLPAPPVPPAPLAQRNAFVRLAGRTYVVDAADDTTLTVRQAVAGPAVPVPSGGVRALVCARPATLPPALDYSQPNARVLVSEPTVALQSYLQTLYPTQAVSVTELAPAQFDPPLRHDLNERAWDVTFGAPLNSLDPLLFAVDPALGWGVSAQASQLGTASASGGFRLAFAGFNRTNETLVRLLTRPDLVPADYPPGAFGVVSDKANAGANSSAVLLAAFTRVIPILASPDDVASALAELPNIGPGVVSVARVDVAAASTNATDGSPDLVGVAVWDIRFSGRAIAANYSEQQRKYLRPDVPQLVVADVKPLQGTGASTAVATLVQGSGNMSETRDAVYVQAAGALNSPCVVNTTRRESRVYELTNNNSVAIAALAELDANMARCAGGATPNQVWNDQDACARVSYSPNVTVSTESGPFCVWREPDFLRRRAEGVPHVNPAQVLLFNWDNRTYGGPSGLTRNANCTVPVTYFAQQLLKIFSLSEAFVATYTAANSNSSLQVANPVDYVANKQIYAYINSFLDQYNVCYEDISSVISLPAPKFIKLWQEIVSFTIYTLMLGFVIFSIGFTWRMRKLRVLSPKSLGSLVLIVLVAAGLGAFIGFFLGCLPAAVIAQIYSSIPANLAPINAICLGIAQGLLILYFDLGRGMRMHAAP